MSPNRIFSLWKFYLALAVVPVATSRDPHLQLSSYALPNPMYAFGQTYNSIWV